MSNTASHQLSPTLKMNDRGRDHDGDTPIELLNSSFLDVYRLPVKIVLRIPCQHLSHVNVVF